MNIDKFKYQHADIMSNISALRRLAQAGVAQNAADIAIDPAGFIRKPCSG